MSLRTTRTMLKVRTFTYNKWFIRVGENANENDHLVLNSNPKDVWLHLHNSPSAHAIITPINEDEYGRISPEKDVIESAAMLVKFYSKSKNAPKASVSYTILHNVIKNKRDPPGQVHLKNKPSIIKVGNNEQLLEQLRSTQGRTSI